LSDYLTHQPREEATMAAYALSNIPEQVPENIFYSVVSVTADFDPHKMETYFTLPQMPPEDVRQNANKIAKLINPDKSLTTN